MSMANGLLVVFEGIDGAGKSTQIARLAAFVTSLGLECVSSREPTMGIYGRQLRESALQSRKSVEAEHQLLMLDRREHLAELVMPALARGAVVVLDRYYFSSVAYQSGSTLSEAQILADNEAFARAPDLLFILDLPINISLARIGQRGSGADAFESTETLTRCRDVFLRFATLKYARLLDATRDPIELAQSVRHSLLQRLTQDLSAAYAQKLRAQAALVERSGEFAR